MALPNPGAVERALTFATKNGDVARTVTSVLNSSAGLTETDALSAQLTTITHTAPGTPDYAIQDLTQATPFGFATKDEGNTVLSVIANLQARLAEVEDRLETLGLVAAN